MSEQAQLLRSRGLGRDRVSILSMVRNERHGNTAGESTVKSGAVVVDAGYNEGNIGGVAIDEVLENASLVAPVPGGVGPVTIAMLLEQTVDAAFRLLAHPSVQLSYQSGGMRSDGRACRRGFGPKEIREEPYCPSDTAARPAT
jgi:hypothetical protein